MVKKGLLLLLAVLVMSLTACGGNADPSGGGKSEGEGSSKTAVKKDPIELVVYYPFIQDWSVEDFTKTFAEPIQKKFPHITIKYLFGGNGGQSVQALLTAGERIDILFTSIGATPGNLLDNNLQYDITDLIKKHNFDLGRLEPSMVDAARKLANGGIYGIPILVPPSAMYYNKDIFDKFGVPYPKDGMTWDDVYELSKKLTRTEGGVQYVALGTSYGHMSLMNQLSIPLVDTATLKATFDTDDRWKQWVENLVRFYKIPGHELKPNQMSEPNERNRFFKDRTVAMWLALTALHKIEEVGDMNYDLATYPVFKDKPGVGPQAYPTYFYVTTMSNHKDDAFEVIAYLASDEYQMQRSKEGKFLTVLNNKAVKEVFGQDNALYKGKNVKALQPEKYAPAGSVNKYNSMASGELNRVIKDINSGTKDINTALRDAAEVANKKIQEAETKAK